MATWVKLVPVGDHEKLAEAILEMIENPPEKEKLKLRGRSFSVDQVGEKWFGLLCSIWG